MSNDCGTFEAVGQARRLRFSANAFWDLEEATGVSIFNLLDVLDNNPTLTFIRACIWAGLRSSDDNITTTEAGEIIDEIDVLPAKGALIQAVPATFPPLKGKAGGKNPTPGTAGHGSNSYT